ncbi:MAG: hypothetical protein V1672_03390 [Candidatus Diapherotrites archaeon]
MERLKLNQRGQSSITDALFFLLIVTALASFLFFFAIPYGSDVSERLVIKYRQDYITSSLKTILYSSVPRSDLETLATAKEVDYLVAALNEDYADDQTVNEINDVFRNNIVTIMKPFAPSYDYLFYIYLPGSTPGSDDKFIYTILKLSEFSFDENSRDADVISVTDAVYFCEPPPAGINIIINELLPKVRGKAQANSKLQLPSVSLTSTDSQIIPDDVHVVLVMWISTPLDDELLFGQNTLNCHKDGSELVIP